jgi:hypothetical protein
MKFNAKLKVGILWDFLAFMFHSGPGLDWDL